MKVGKYDKYMLSRTAKKVTNSITDKLTNEPK